MRWTNRLTVLLAVLFFGVTLAPRAHAQTAAAEALFEQGRAAMAKGDLDTACKRFRASDKLDPEPGTKLNLANCEQKRGRIASAWEMFTAAENALPAGDSRISVAKARIAELAPKLPYLTVKVAAGAPAGTTVKDGDAVMAPGSLGVALPVDPGAHRLTVSAPGHAPRTYEVTLAEKQHRTLEVAPGPGSAASAAPAGAAPSGAAGGGGLSPGGSATADQGAGGSSRKTLGYVVGGVGVAGLVVGAITGIMVLGKKSTANANCNDRLHLCNQTGKDANDAGRTLGPISTVGWVVGAIGVGAGAYLILTSDGKSETALATHVAPDGASVSLVRSF